jgi:hypothetical protein
MTHHFKLTPIMVKHRITGKLTKGYRKAAIAREMNWKPQELDDAFIAGTFPPYTVQLVSTSFKAVTRAQGQMLIAYSKLAYGQARALFLEETIRPQWDV